MAAFVDDPVFAADYLVHETPLTPEQEEKYAYKTTLMNDVHMSHAMEFPYPMSMANCATCHEGKLDTVLSDANFKIETCKSCHPMTGAVGLLKREKKSILRYNQARAEDHTARRNPWFDGFGYDGLHGLSWRGKTAKPFNQIHTGYDKAIYTAEGLKYSEAISVTVDSASLTQRPQFRLQCARKIKMLGWTRRPLRQPCWSVCTAGTPRTTSSARTRGLSTIMAMAQSTAVNQRTWNILSAKNTRACRLCQHQVATGRSLQTYRPGLT